MPTPIREWKWLLLAALLAPVAAWGQARLVQPLDAGWLYHRDGDAALQPVNLPHSPDGASAGQAPHGVDGASASPAPVRGPSWYRHTLDLPRQPGQRRHFLEFDGAMLVTEAWVNGHYAGRHVGGFARFRFDVTPWLKPGPNELLVRVDNARNTGAAPLGGDYTMPSGLYRPVRLVSTADVHFDMLDYGGPGVYFKPGAVSAEQAALAWTARVANTRDRPLRAVVTAHLRDAGRRVVATAREAVTLPPNSVTAVELEATLAAPHLWQGARDPYLYTSEAELSVGAAANPLDRLAFQTGLRAIRLDPQQGLLLNGAPYPVYGVNLHQTSLPGKAFAVGDADIDADYRILSELGVTGLRFAHYQHAQHGYDLADRLGWLVWTELPLTSEVDGADAFLDNSFEQLHELIRQNRNHPSVMVWGLGNEIYRVDATSARVLSMLQRVAHEEDPGRPTVYANCCGPIDGAQAMHTDAIGSNVYFGWYDGAFADLGPFLDANHARRPSTPESVSEYGAGAGASQQEDPPQRPQPGGRWHPEQYQALYHEAAWRQLAARPWLWAKFIWVGFDFPSAGRNEGERAGFNDKGLVSYDRRVKKDAYYWYQANWTTRPMAYITSRRHTARTAADVEVKVYSNQPSASLRLNGVELGAQPVIGHVASWKVQLAAGSNRLQVTAGAATDTVEWDYQAAAGPGQSATK